MKNKKIPLRTCVITKEKLPKQELIRVVKDNENNVFIDLTGKSNGRGAYIKRDINVLDTAIKTKALSRQLEVEIPDGKNIDYIDVSGDEPTPVFKDVPKTQSEDIAEIKSQIEWIALMADIELPEEE